MKLTCLPVAVLAAFTGCDLLAPRSHTSAESGAVPGLVVILSGQATFHKTDFYGKGELLYANLRDGRGVLDLYQLPNGKVVGLVNKAILYGSGEDASYRGYLFASLEGSADSGPYDPAIEFGVCAVPARYGERHREVFVMDVSGAVDQIDAASLYPDIQDGEEVPALKLYPSGEELAAKWGPVGD